MSRATPKKLVIGLLITVPLTILVTYFVATWWYSRYSIPAEFVHTSRSEHFHFRSDLPADQLAAYQRRFEGFYGYFHRAWFPITQSRPLNVLLFGDEAVYEKWCKAEGYAFTRFGFYCGPTKNLIVVNSQSGLGTSFHELVHHFIEETFATSPPPFLDEGFATFFEKFIGHLDERGDFHLTVGYFSNWRFPITKALVQNYDITKMWNSDYQDVEQGVARSFMLFLHRRGHLRTFMSRMVAESGDGRKLLEDIYGQPLAKIVAAWRQWVEAQPLEGDVKLVPRAFVHDAADWEAWWQRERQRLVFDESMKIYRVR